jgi:hypothetical protein
VPPSPAFWQALLAAQKAAPTMLREEPTEAGANARVKWKFSKTESWIKLSRELLHAHGIVLTQSAALAPMPGGGPVPQVKGTFVFTAVRVEDGTGWWWAFDWPHYGELRGGPELAWRMSLTLSWKYAVRAILQVPQGDEGDETEAQDPRYVEGGVQPWRPEPQAPVQPFHEHRGQQHGQHQPWQGQRQAGPAPGPRSQGAHGPARGGHGHAGGGGAGFGPVPMVGGANGQAPRGPVDQEPIVIQAHVELQSTQLGNAPPAQFQPQQFDATPGDPGYDGEAYGHEYDEVTGETGDFQQHGVPQQPQGQVVNQSAPPGRDAPQDGQPDPTYEDLKRSGWNDPFARRLAALGANEKCPDDLREGFLSSCSAFFGGDRAAMLAPWAGTGFAPAQVPAGQPKPLPTGCHMRRYAVKLDWTKKAAPAAGGR